MGEGEFWKGQEGEEVGGVGRYVDNGRCMAMWCVCVCVCVFVCVCDIEKERER